MNHLIKKIYTATLIFFYTSDNSKFECLLMLINYNNHHHKKYRTLLKAVRDDNLESVCLCAYVFNG